MKGVVIKNITDTFDVFSDGKVFFACKGRGKTKLNGKILVGDYVDFEVDNGTNVINSILKRKNEIVRPPMANLDNLVIVISQIPKPDFSLVDKLILKCILSQIEPIIVVSKLDVIDKEFIDDVKSQYENVVNHLFIVSSFTGDGLSELEELLKNKVSSLAGQSAVGKSSIIKAFGGEAKVGEVSKRNLRGKNTTRHTEIQLLKSNIMIADTAGFSRLAFEDVKYTDLMRYYPDFVNFAVDCKYNSCVHINEKCDDCGVKKALKACKINTNRYNRYKLLYEEMKKYWENKYE